MSLAPLADGPNISPRHHNWFARRWMRRNLDPDFSGGAASWSAAALLRRRTGDQPPRRPPHANAQRERRPQVIRNERAAAVALTWTSTPPLEPSWRPAEAESMPSIAAMVHHQQMALTKHKTTSFKRPIRTLSLPHGARWPTTDCCRSATDCQVGGRDGR